MIAAWMLYAVLVAVLLGLAAHAIERALRLARRQGRWTWALALAASLVIPVLAVRSGPAAPASVGLASVAVAAGHLVAAPLPAPTPVLASLDRALVVSWVAASAVVLLLLLRGQMLLRRQAARGDVREVAGHLVCVSDGPGPAVVGGLRRATIMLPAWVAGLDARASHLAVRHEAEHLATGDVRLLAIAVLAVVACPWNLAIWWQLFRLRDAVELDCDLRLVRAGVDVQAYGELLLEVARRSHRRGLAVALAARPSLLSRRIDHMTPAPARARGVRVLAGTALGVALAILACEAPGPADRSNPSAPVLDIAQVDAPPARLSSPPLRYPPLLRDAGISGQVVVEFVVSADGTVDSASVVVVSSDHLAFERPAVDLIKGSRFRPATIGGRATAVRIRQPISFSVVKQGEAVPDKPGIHVTATPVDPTNP